MTDIQLSGYTVYPATNAIRRVHGGKSGDKRKRTISHSTAGKISNVFPAGNSSVNWEIGRKAKTEREGDGEGGYIKEKSLFISITMSLTKSMYNLFFLLLFPLMK